MLAEQNGAIFLRRQVEWPGAAVVQHDAQFRLGEQLEEVRARRFEADFQHVVGHCLDLVDHAQLDLEVVAAGAAYRRLEPLRDLLGRDGLPVRPFGADETKRVSKAVIRHDPALRQRRLDLPRSEEHTSELQSLMRISYAVFCLKKKK